MRRWFGEVLWWAVVATAFLGTLHVARGRHTAEPPGTGGSEWAVDPRDEALQREIARYEGREGT